MLGLIIQAYLGDRTPELSEAGKKVFLEVVECMRHTSYPLGFEHPPDYTRHPSPSTDSSARTREAAKTLIVWDLNDAVLRERPSLGADMAGFADLLPAKHRGILRHGKGCEGNQCPGSSGELHCFGTGGMKNSGVEGTALNGVMGVESWAVFDFESLFQRGADNPVLPHTWTITSCSSLPPPDDLGEGGANSGGGHGCSGGAGAGGEVATRTLADVLDGDAARRHLGLGLFLDRQASQMGWAEHSLSQMG